MLEVLISLNLRKMLTATTVEDPKRVPVIYLVVKSRLDLINSIWNLKNIR